MKTGRRLQDAPPTPLQSSTWIETVSTALLAFFDEHARVLPWREDRDVYRVWISEIMLQQTRVEAVLPFYDRWMQRFPSLDALASAPLDDVLKVWEGLGYYSRARNLHATAQLVRERHGGRFPDEYDDLRALPGIGDYTAGAIASIVYGQAHPAVDGNVRRVLARLLDQDLDGRALQGAAATLVPVDRPGDFNQALMELGATICTPRSPRCDRCPLRGVCVAYRNGTQTQRPARKRRAQNPLISIAVAVLRDQQDRVLLVRRPDTGLLAGMWELPAAAVRADEDPADAALRAARRWTRQREASLASDEPITTVTHVFSHRTERYHAYAIEGSWMLPETVRRVWHQPGRPSSHAIPRAQQRLLQDVARVDEA